MQYHRISSSYFVSNHHFVRSSETPSSTIVIVNRHLSSKHHHQPSSSLVETSPIVIIPPSGLGRSNQNRSDQHGLEWNRYLANDRTRSNRHHSMVIVRDTSHILVRSNQMSEGVSMMMVGDISMRDDGDVSLDLTK